MEGDVKLMKAVFVNKIYQKDNFTFTIEWSDGIIKNYRLSDLQKRCPCAGCVDEATGTRVADQSLIPVDLRAKRIMSVGRYALRVQFVSGCSHGIYSFDFLRGGHNE
jgi:ATP-binding protein involved in chromosome partitioning